MTEFVAPPIIEDRGPAEVVDFPDPFVHRVHRVCRECRQPVEVILLAGATPPNGQTFTCASCLNTPSATAAVIEQSRPQLRIVEGSDGG